MSDTLDAATQKSGKLGVGGTNVGLTKLEVNFAKSWKWESRFAYCNNLTKAGSKDPSLSIAKIQEKKLEIKSIFFRTLCTNFHVGAQTFIRRIPC